MSMYNTQCKRWKLESIPLCKIRVIIFGKKWGVPTNEHCMGLTLQKWSVCSLYKSGCGGKE